MSKQFLDTNIFVYAIDADSTFYSRARSVLLTAQHDLYTSLKNLSEFLAVVTRIGEPPLSITDALAAVDSFSSLCTILYPTPASTETFYALLRQYHTTGLEIHDVEIASMAIANDLTDIVTFNTADFNFIDTIRCIEPTE